MRRFTFPIQLHACLFALLGFISRLLSVSICVHLWLLVIYVCFSSISYASSPPTTDVHFCEVLDYEALRARDSLYAATKQAFDLNVGEPRTVRMIYFLPNDRPFQQAVVDSMKVTIREIQTFYADQMEAHGYGRKTFRFETDAQGDPVVHRVDGRHPNSYYLKNRGDWLEIREKFDTRANNVYLTVWDNGTGGVVGALGRGGGRRDGGGAVVSARYRWTTVAHELGHTFGLRHDFRSGAYIMSYGYGWRNRSRELSACHAEFLAVHPYFNTSSEDKETPEPTIELISPTGYVPGSTTVSIQLKVSDPDGLHQVILFVNSRRGFAGGTREVKACRGLSGEKHTVVQFDYNGAVPSDSTYKRVVGTLSDPLLHSINVRAVDSFGNVGSTYFTLFDISTQRNVIATLEGHTNRVNSVAFSPDGKMLASASDDLTVKFWDVSKRTNIATLKGHAYSPRRDGVNSVAFSPDGKMLASAGGDLTVKLWDVSRRITIATLEGHVSNNRWRDGVNSVAFLPDGKMLASAGADLTVKLWDVSKRTNIATLEGHVFNTNGGVNSVAFSPDSKILASGAYDQTVTLWDVATKQNIATLRQGNSSFVYSVVFSPDGSILASGTRNGVKLWDAATEQNIAPSMATEDSYSVAFSPDGSILASGTTLGIEIVHVATKRILATFTGHTKRVQGLSFSPDGSTLASASEDSTIKLWDMSELPLYPQTIVKISGDRQEGAPNALLADPLVVEVRDQNDNVLEGFPVTFTTTSGNGRLSGKFTVENTMTDVDGRAQSTLTLGPNPGTNTVEVSVTGLDPVIFNAVGVGTPAIPIMGGDYQTWHLPDDAVVRLGKGTIGESDRAVAFSPDGQRLAVASGIGVWLYEVATSQPLALLPSESSVNSVVFSSDGTLLASGLNNGRVELWVVETGTKVAMFEGHMGYTNSVAVAVAVSSDGTMLASGSRDRTIKLWDIATKRNIATLEGHTSIVNSVVFSPDGTLLASGSRDRTIKLWDIATKRNIATLEGHTSIVNSVVFSLMGRCSLQGAIIAQSNFGMWRQGAILPRLRGIGVVSILCLFPPMVQCWLQG